MPLEPESPTTRGELPTPTWGRVRGLSSMATKAVLADLATLAAQAGMAELEIESSGGVEVAQRVREGAAADLVILAPNAIDALAADGHVLARSVNPLFVSEVAVAVPAGADPIPDISTEQALREAILDSERIGYSTGPSGDALIALIERWGLTDEVSDRLVQARPGVPVARTLAEGGADIGFQQRSELLGADGIQVLGPMPAGCEIVTVFTGAVCAAAEAPAAAAAVLGFLASEHCRPVIERHGMHQPGPPSDPVTEGDCSDPD